MESKPGEGSRFYVTIPRDGVHVEKSKTSDDVNTLRSGGQRASGVQSDDQQRAEDKNAGEFDTGSKSPGRQNETKKPDVGEKKPDVFSSSQNVRGERISGGLKILIAEDDTISEMLLVKHVKNFSRETIVARNGLEAVEACRNNPDTDLILMDIQMPEMNGYEATRKIREFNGDVVIIAQTAFGLSGDREKALQTGCNDYLSKPVRRDLLKQLVSKYFG